MIRTKLGEARVPDGLASAICLRTVVGVNAAVSGESLQLVGARVNDINKR